MKIFEGKTPTEKKKLIAALVLGALALFVLGYNVIGMFTGGKKTVNVSVNTSPTPTPAVQRNTEITAVPNLDEQTVTNDYIITPVVYTGPNYAPEAGRNIFAFYEPGKPDPNAPTPPPTPIVTPDVPTPTPPPPPEFTLAFVSPQSIYAGSKGFRLEVNGDKFTPDALIIWDGMQMPTTFVSPQKLTADIFDNQIAAEGQRQIMVRTPDGKKFSMPGMLTVQAPPKPNYDYIGIMARNRSNNDTATLIESNKQAANPFNVRLNDVVGGRFRMVSISVNEVILEDTSLGFRHRLPIARAQGSGSGGGGMTPSTGRGGFDNSRGPGGRFPQNNAVPQYNPPPATVYNPTMPSTQQSIPGIPDNIPRYVPPTPQQPQQKKDTDQDDEDGN